MPTRQILFDAEAHAKIAKGVETVARAVGSTMGPRGRAVAIASNDPFRPPTFTVDGVTVANNVELSDPFERVGADAVRTASRKSNSEAGDGTTAAAVLTNAIYSEGRRRINNGENPIAVKAQIERECAAAVSHLKSQAKPIDSHDALEKIATISAKDKALGEVIASTVRDAGDGGIVTVEYQQKNAVEAEITKGLRLDSGYVMPLVNDQNRNTAMLQDVAILVTNQAVTQDVAHLMNKLIGAGRRELVVVADDFSPDALAVMFTNAQAQKFFCVAVRATGLGDHRKKESLRDLCAAVGATLVTEETGKTVKDATPDLCGRARQVTVSKSDTLIVEGAGKPEEVESRVNAIKAEMETEQSDYNKEKLRERLSRLNGVAAVIRVGGTNEADARERKQRVEDAVCAVRAAKEEGVVVGGGMALLNVCGSMDVLKKPFQEPLRRIATNAGHNPDVTLEKCFTQEAGVGGFNAATGEYGDLFAQGVIDPCKVVRVALENACSVAGLLLVTDTLIVEEPAK